MASLRSQLSPTLSNEFKFGYYFNDRGNVINTSEHPQLWLTLSKVAGQNQAATLVGRYNRWTPELQIKYTALSTIRILAWVNLILQ